MFFYAFFVLNLPRACVCVCVQVCSNFVHKISRNLFSPQKPILKSERRSTDAVKNSPHKTNKCHLLITFRRNDDFSIVDAISWFLHIRNVYVILTVQYYFYIYISNYNGGQRRRRHFLDCAQLVEKKRERINVNFELRLGCRMQ